MRLRSVWCVVLGWAVFVPPAMCQCVPTERAPHIETFSTLRDIPGLSSPAEIELTVELQGSNAGGRLRDFEGTASPLETKLVGTLNGCDLHLSGKNSRGRVDILGKLLVSNFQGAIVRKLGRQEYSENVVLRRKISLDENRVALLAVPAWLSLEEC